MEGEGEEEKEEEKGNKGAVVGGAAILERSITASRCVRLE